MIVLIDNIFKKEEVDVMREEWRMVVMIINCFFVWIYFIMIVIILFVVLLKFLWFRKGEL